MADRPPRSRTPFFAIGFERRESDLRASRRQVFRINFLNCGAEWLSSLAALGLLGFYSYALIMTPDPQREGDNYKLLAANVILSLYMRLCYILHTSSKTWVLFKQGPVETSVLPMQSQISSISSLMFIVEPGHFVCLCWITHISFPFKDCDGMSYWAACRSLHIMSTIFVAAWVLTGLAFAFLILCFTMFERGGRANQSMERTLRMAPIPNHIRESVINALPLSEEPPADGEVCAICCDIEEQREGGLTQWRILPCNHRFHPTCVDEWLKKNGGTCPTCRHDPALGPRETATGPHSSTAQGNQLAVGLVIERDSERDYDGEAGHSTETASAVPTAVPSAPVMPFNSSDASREGSANVGHEEPCVQDTLPSSSKGDVRLTVHTPSPVHSAVHSPGNNNQSVSRDETDLASAGVPIVQSPGAATPF